MFSEKGCSFNILQRVKLPNISKLLLAVALSTSQLTRALNGTKTVGFCSCLTIIANYFCPLKLGVSWFSKSWLVILSTKYFWLRFELGNLQSRGLVVFVCNSLIPPKYAVANSRLVQSLTRQLIRTLGSISSAYFIMASFWFLVFKLERRKGCLVELSTSFSIGY